MSLEMELEIWLFRILAGMTWVTNQSNLKSRLKNPLNHEKFRELKNSTYLLKYVGTGGPLLVRFLLARISN